MSSTETSTDHSVAPSNTGTKAKPAIEDVSTKKPSKNSSSRFFNWFIYTLIVLLLTATASGGYYYWLELQKTLRNLEITNIQQSVSFDQLADQFEQQQQQNLEKMKLLISKQQDQLDQLQQTQQTLILSSQNSFNISHRSQSQWVMAEASYLLSLANQRLIVARDVSSAVLALRAANNRLHELSDPSLLSLRKSIAADVSTLNLIALPDINGIAFELDNITGAISKLALKTRQQKMLQQEQPSEVVDVDLVPSESYFAPVWQRIKSLVIIRKHNTGPEDPVIASLTKVEIDKQLRYRIEASRLALLNSNSAVFNAEVSAALSLLSTHYDLSDNRAVAIQQQLLPLSTLALLPELPDISGSWLRLQKKIKTSDAMQTNNTNRGKSLK